MSLDKLMLELKGGSGSGNFGHGGRPGKRGGSTSKGGGGSSSPTASEVGSFSIEYNSNVYKTSSGKKFSSGDIIKDKSGNQGRITISRNKPTDANPQIKVVFTKNMRPWINEVYTNPKDFEKAVDENGWNKL